FTTVLVAQKENGIAPNGLEGKGGVYTVLRQGKAGKGARREHQYRIGSRHAGMENGLFQSGIPRRKGGNRKASGILLIEIEVAGIEPGLLAYQPKFPPCGRFL